MPKRAKTPPPADGAKFLTVVGPYPAHPNMELEQHRREFARWIGSIAGPDYLWAFYHKPTVRYIFLTRRRTHERV
ncbi:hypothetical protein C8Q77DRAFT_1065371 [Trametes polyzona]|nr:hypothetical protein C8Q77DRAFT_1065371 [Trametes polyzona]